VTANVYCMFDLLFERVCLEVLVISPEDE